MQYIDNNYVKNESKYMTLEKFQRISTLAQFETFIGFLRVWCLHTQKTSSDAKFIFWNYQGFYNELCKRDT
jgi:hypothetical protein